jgi:hypothetical protein
VPRRVQSTGHTSENGERTAVMVRPWPGDDCPAQRRSLPNLSTFCHRDLFGHHGRFDSSVRVACDYQYPPREIVRGDAAFVDEVMPIMGICGLLLGAATRPTSARVEARARSVHGLRPWSNSVRSAVLGAFGHAWALWLPLTAVARGARTGTALMRRARLGRRSR